MQPVYILSSRYSYDNCLKLLIIIYKNKFHVEVSFWVVRPEEVEGAGWVFELVWDRTDGRTGGEVVFKF